MTVEHRLVTAERDRVKAQKTKNQMERLVEDLIQEGMANGAFDNLAGAGKPLPERPPDFNPYMDFTTHKMNQVLDIIVVVVISVVVVVVTLVMVILDLPDLGGDRLCPRMGGTSEGDPTPKRGPQEGARQMQVRPTSKPFIFKYSKLFCCKFALFVNFFQSSDRVLAQPLCQRRT